MLTEALRVPYAQQDETLGIAGSLPYLPLTLTYKNSSLATSGLLDTGAAVNVLPYDVGRRLNAVWEEQRTTVRLTGNLERFEARAILVTATVGTFAPVPLALAWTRTNDVPLILGQVNFFLEFEACFSRALKFFEVRPRVRGGP